MEDSHIRTSLTIVRVRATINNRVQDAKHHHFATNCTRSEIPIRSTLDNSVLATNTTNSSDFSATNSFSIGAHREPGPNVEGASHTRCGVPILLEPAQSYELKSNLIHLLPKFHGLASEDLHKHLKEFHVVCLTMRPQGILEIYIKMKVVSLVCCLIPHIEALMDKTPATARHLISNMVSNTQQFGIRGPNQSRTVNEIGAASNQRLENQLTELTSLVRQLAVSQHQPAMAAKLCGICTFVEQGT
ncbi:hypothetical protein CR513_30959, partial [Mucuna pruriens]